VQQCHFAGVVKVLAKPGLVERRLMSYFHSGIVIFCGFMVLAGGIGESSLTLDLFGLFFFAFGLFFVIRR
jgi:hypothetical protein